MAEGALQGCFLILNQTLDSAKSVVSTLDPSLKEKVAGPGATDANRGTVGKGLGVLVMHRSLRYPKLQP